MTVWPALKYSVSPFANTVAFLSLNIYLFLIQNGAELGLNIQFKNQIQNMNYTYIQD